MMRLLLIIAATLMVGCSSNLVARALDNSAGNIQAGNCTKGTARSTLVGQTNTGGQTCTCTISKEAGVRVTSATVSADENGRCEMTIAPIDTVDVEPVQ